MRDETSRTHRLFHQPPAKRGPTPAAGLRVVAPERLDQLLALTRATSLLLEDLGVDVQLTARPTPVLSMRDACRAVELDVAVARLGRRRMLPGERPAPDVRGRAADVLRRLLMGESEKEIAAWLALSPHTVHVYVKAIYRRYAVHSRSELMALFIEGQNE